MHEITRQALAREDHQWRPADGYVVVWQMTNPKGQASSFFWGRGPEQSARLNGWKSCRHAAVFLTYQEAVAQVPLVMEHDPFWTFNVSESDIRILKVSIRHPVEILEDLPASILDELARVRPVDE